MSLEKNIERIADALEAIAKRDVSLSPETLTALAAVFAAGQITVTATDAKKVTTRRTAPPPAETVVENEPAPAEEVQEPVDDMGLDDPEPVEEAEKFTEDQVRKALKNYRDINGPDATMAALRDHGDGATGMGTLKPEHYAAVMKIVR